MNLKHAFWNYTGAGHGKSVADAVGGTVKSLCDRKVMHGKDILSAKDIHDVIKNDNCKAKSFLISEIDVENIDKIIPLDLKAVKDTTLVHQVVWVDSKKESLSFRYLSCYECKIENGENCIHHSLKNSKITYEPQKESTIKNYSEGDWIVVMYDKIWYPGIVLKIESQLIKTKFLEYKDNFFKLPLVDGVQEVYATQILCQIEIRERVKEILH